MKSLLRLFGGVVNCTVHGGNLEIFLNLCAKKGLYLSSVHWKSKDCFTCDAKRWERRRMQEVGEKCRCEVEERPKNGLFEHLIRFRRCYALLLGFLGCILTVSMDSRFTGSRFIFFIEIEGNGSVSKAEILTTLRRLGIKPGVYGPSIIQRELAHEVLLAMDELMFFSLNLHGTRAEVIVRERQAKPDIMDSKAHGDVVADAAGIITHMEVMEGEALVREGETVVEGDVLIAGRIDIKAAEYMENKVDLGEMFVHAQGKIYARSWHTITAKSPLELSVKEYTGKTKKRYALCSMGQQIKFYGNGGISFDHYDKIRSTKTIEFPEAFAVPIALERESMRQYEIRTMELAEEPAEEMLKEQLLAKAQARIGDDGEILRTDFVSKKADGFLEVTLLAECSEQIGREVPIEGDAAEESLE